jgi:hypothetical protein
MNKSYVEKDMFMFIYHLQSIVTVMWTILMASNAHYI